MTKSKGEGSGPPADGERQPKKGVPVKMPRGRVDAALRYEDPNRQESEDSAHAVQWMNYGIIGFVLTRLAWEFGGSALARLRGRGARGGGGGDPVVGGGGEDGPAAGGDGEGGPAAGG